MLKSLHIENYILIDSLEISFPSGLVIVTGQTGAGKSILLGALNLLLGGKADPGLVGGRGDRCVVEALFDVAGNAAAAEIVRENDLEWEGGRLILRRVFGRSGRARAFLNDAPVTVAALSKLAAGLLDIHSQSDTARLADRAFQLSVLDHYAGNAERLADYSALWNQTAALERRLSATKDRLAKLASEKEYTLALLEKLEEARLRDGELEALEAEQKRLAHAEEIKEELCGMEAALGGEEERPGPATVLREVSRRLDRLSAYLPPAAALASRMETCRLELDDVLSEISGMEGKTEVSPERLEAVESRLSLLYGLLAKHGCRTVAELLAIREKFSETILDSSALEEERKHLEEEIGQDRRCLEAWAAELGESRRRAAGPLSAKITETLKFLELEQAVFDIRVEPALPSASGGDAVSFRFSALGGEPIEVSKCASGGERSRIMLCLKAIMAKYTAMPSMVFDEIDTGVSGSAADRMGSMICAMGRNMQVFAITHLPQVAAKGKAHFLVTKTGTSGGQAVTQIREITGEARVREIARLLSGAEITPEAVANAVSLLK